MSEMKNTDSGQDTPVHTESPKMGLGTYRIESSTNSPHPTGAPEELLLDRKQFLYTRDIVQHADGSRSVKITSEYPSGAVSTMDEDTVLSLRRRDLYNEGGAAA